MPRTSRLLHRSPRPSQAPLPPTVGTPADGGLACAAELRAPSESSDEDEDRKAAEKKREENRKAAAAAPKKPPVPRKRAVSAVNEEGAGAAGDIDIKGPTLVVCPLSVANNWETQIKARRAVCVALRLTRKRPIDASAAQTHCPQLRFGLYHGPNRERDPEKLRQFHVVITTYTILAQDFSGSEAEREAEALAAETGDDTLRRRQNNDLLRGGTRAFRAVSKFPFQVR
jgi:hypothetical protein